MRDKIAVLLVQLGSPDRPEPKALKKYLRQFLWDPRIIEDNRAVWWFVLHGIVLPRRSKTSAQLYSKIWTDDGPPLKVFTEQQAQKLEESLHSQLPHTADKLRVFWAMRYGSPSIRRVLEEIESREFEQLLVFPLFPQYSGTTVGSIYDQIFQYFAGKRFVPAIRLARSFYGEPGFIDACSQLIAETLSSEEFEPDALIFSFHGIPAHYAEKGDPYPKMCEENFRLLREKLQPLLPKSQFFLAYQSRFGRAEWTKPYLDELVSQLPEKGIRNLAIFPACFVSDCLETLWELEFEVGELFLHSGGKKFLRIPAPNLHPSWLSFLRERVISELGGWL